jgi:hypothetical protein
VAVSALPKRDLAAERGFTPQVMSLFNVTEQGDRWVYQTRRMGRVEPGVRSKSFYSVAPAGQEKTWQKYNWVPSKPDGALYFYPPSLALADMVKAADGVLYMSGGDMGTMSLMSAGLMNATNTFGDSAIPATIAEDIRKLGVKRLVLLPDRDTSGQRWGAKIRDLMIPVGIEIEVDVRALPFDLKDKHGQDVNDWWLQILDATAPGEDEAATLRDAITQLPPWHLPEPERKTATNADAVLAPLEMPADFIRAIEARLDVDPHFNGTGWTRKPVRCPLHDDAHPSAFWNRHMAILRCFSGCQKTYLAKEVGAAFGLDLRDYLSATPRIPMATTAGGTTVAIVTKTESAPEPAAASVAASAPTGNLRPPLPAYAALSDEDMRLATVGRGWLNDYVRWATRAAPASPEIFHEAMGLWLLASVSTRRVALPVSGEMIYPNLYILIVAKTSLYRKTTAMKQVRRLMEAAGMEPLRLPEDATPEALFDELSGVKPSNFDAMTDSNRADWLKGRAVAAQRTFIKDEASSIFADLRKDYKAGLAELLLQGYDGDGGRISKLLKARGLITLKDMCLSFLGATTPVMMAKYMTNEEQENGFAARFAIVTPEGPPVYQESGDAVGVPAALVDRVRSIFNEVLPWHNGKQPVAASEYGEVISPPVMKATAEPNAMKRLLAYRRALGFDMIEQDVVSEDKSASYSRIPTLAMKIATLLAMSETQPGQTVTIHESNALAALLIAERWRESLHRLDRDTARATGNRTQDRLLEYLRSAGPGGATLRDISRDCRVRDQRDATDALKVLADAGLIEMFQRKPPRGPASSAYRIADVGGSAS